MLTERQKLILKMIIDSYVHSAEPVGSRAISKKDTVKYSSATVRNEMSDLEDMGYLEQPHTSAGRIPSQKGYRFYVDYLMEPASLLKADIDNIRQQLYHQKMQVEEIVGNTASILADLTHYTAIALGPEVFHTKLKTIQLIPINQAHCVCLLVTDTGHVEKKIAEIPPELPSSKLEQLTNILNAKLVGTPLYKLSHILYHEVAKELEKNVAYYEHAMEFLEGVIVRGQTQENREVFLKGTTYMLSQPEFKDLDKVKTILNLFEQNGLVMDLFHNPSTEIQVKIGQENKIIEAQNCSIITANYIFDGKPIGSIGVIGPTRLDYAKVTALIRYLSNDLSKILNTLYRE